MAPKEWPGFDITGPEELMDDVEAVASAVLNEQDLLGTSREDRFFAANPDKPAAPDASSNTQTTLKLYLSPQANAEQCAAVLQETMRAAFSEAFAAGIICLSPFSLPNEDWAVLWRDFYRPIRISERLVILPAWWDEAQGLRDTGASKEEVSIVRIEPGRAFGSGNHATTQLALRFMESLLTPGDRVLDFGAGSGILSFAAAALGAGPIADIEIDGECIDNFSDNIRINHFEGRIEYRIGSSELIRPEERFDIVFCNILFQNAEPHITKLGRSLSDNGKLILSGYLTNETDAVRKRVEGAKLRVVEMRDQEEWGGMVAVKK